MHKNMILNIAPMYKTKVGWIGRKTVKQRERKDNPFVLKPLKSALWKNKLPTTNSFNIIVIPPDIF